MNKKAGIFLVVVILLAGGFYAYDKSHEAKAPVQEFSQEPNKTNKLPVSEVTPQTFSTSPATSTPSKKTVPAKTPEVQGHYSSGEEGGDGPDVSVVEVSYDGIKYTPTSINIKVGDYIIFKNTSDKTFWPVADSTAHPSYAGFGAKQAIAAGSKYQFQFIKPGTFGFKDQTNPSARGVVNVVK